MGWKSAGKHPRGSHKRALQTVSGSHSTRKEKKRKTHTHNPTQPNPAPNRSHNIPDKTFSKVMFLPQGVVTRGTLHRALDASNPWVRRHLLVFFSFFFTDVIIAEDSHFDLSWRHDVIVTQWRSTWGSMRRLIFKLWPLLVNIVSRRLGTFRGQMRGLSSV